MKKYYSSFLHQLTSLFLPLLSILIGILILKQISAYERMINIIQALVPVMCGGVIAFLLQPIIDKCQTFCSKKLSVFVVYFGIVFLLIIFVVGLSPVIYNQFMEFAQRVPSWILKIEEFLQKYHIEYEYLENIKSGFMEEGYTIVLDSLWNVMDTVTFYGIGFMTAFFISIDLEFWLHTLQKITPNMKRFTTFYKTMSNIVYQYLVGTFLDLAFITVSTWIILQVVDFPNAILYAFLLAILNLFPYIGPTIGLIIIIIVGLLSYQNPPYISFFIVWTVQQIEGNIIQPIIFNKTMDVRPILTFISLFISEALFGIPGVILSPIFAAIIQIAFRSYLHSKTSDRVGEWEDIWYDFDDVMRKSKFDT